MTPPISDQIVRSLEIKAPRPRVWKAIITESEFCQWFGVRVLEGKFQPGTRVKMASTHPGYEGIEFYVAVEKMDAPRLFSWRWIPGAEQPKDEPTTLVEFALAETGEGTRVTITESGFDRLSLAYREKAFKDNTGGWDYQAKSLAKYVTQNA